MKTNQLIIASASVMLLLGSCDVKDPIYYTAHPNQGRVTLTTDWSHIGKGLTVPESYTVSAADYSAIVSGTTNTLDYLFDPGTCEFRVYNTAEHISVDGTTATVASTPTPAAQTGAFINNTPGWFFSFSSDMLIEKDKELAMTATMQQHIGQLTLIIELTGGTAAQVKEITATLTGVAGAFDFKTETYTAPSSVSLTFSEITDGTDAGKWKADARLLGILGIEQLLAGSILFTDNVPSVDFDSNLSTFLASFNTNKRNPLTLGGAVVETPTEVGFTSTIKEWEIVVRDPVTAE